MYFIEKKYSLVILILFFGILPFSSYCQNMGASHSGIRWSKAPFDSKVFIENRGQFSTGNPGNEKILFQARLGEIEMNFTAHGLTYRYTRVVEKMDNDRDADGEKGPESTHFFPPETHTCKMEWANSNPVPVISAEEEQPDYYCYQPGDNTKTIRVNAFKKITYHNLYPGIDVEYYFPEKGDGIRYDLVIRPGADASKIKMLYTGLQFLGLDGMGNIVLLMTGKKVNDLIDSIPHTFYSDSKKPIASSFTKNGNEVSFAIGKYDKSREITIDPWVTNPSFTNSNVAFDIAKDLAGNVYVYGGGGGGGSDWKLKKFTPSGTAVWTYVTSFNSSGSWYGDLAVDLAGNSYITEGCCSGSIQRISPSGSALWTVNNGVYEYWVLTFDCSYTNLYLGCAYSAGKIPAESISHLDTATGAITGAKALSTGGSEPRDIAWAPNSNIYFLTCAGNNRVLGVTSAFAGVFSVSSGYSLKYNGPSYANGGNTTSGSNDIAACKTFFCTSDGDTLKKRNLNTGAVMATVKIPGGVVESNSGVYIDACNNVYAGSQSAVYEYDSLLNPVTNISTKGAVYCLFPAGNGEILVSGNGFIAKLDFPDDSASYTITKTITPPSCSNCNGTAEATLAICGNMDTTDATYAWSNGQTTRTATNLCPGNTYTLTINLACGEQYIDTFPMPLKGGAFKMTETQTNPTCGVCNGSAKVVASGGGPPYTYSWSPGGQTTATATGLCQGTYTISVTDSCGDVISAIVTLTATDIPVTAKVTAEDKCNASCAGSAVANVSIGNPPYTYRWTPLGGSNATATGLCAGTYTITVKDSKGCTGTVTAIITQPSTITATDTVNNVLCNGGTGSAKVTPGDGSSPYTYLWTPSKQTTAIATGLSAGSYTVKITDSSGCTATSIATLTQPALLTSTISATNNILCYGGTGSATVSAGGGTSPYFYSWAKAGGSGATGTGLTAGSYTVTVTDHNGCIATAVATITQPPALSIATSFTKASCNKLNGTATAAISGGTSPYTYLWTPSAETNGTATGLSIGTYTIMVTDKNSCTAGATVTITQASLVTATITATTNVSCYNGANGSATVTGSGGTTPYIYLWNPSGQTISAATGLFALSYTATITDNNGCSATASVNLTEPTQITAAISEPRIICKDSTGILIANASGGTPPYKYNWSSGATSGIATITPVATNNYSVIITDAHGCSATADIVLQYGPSFAVVISGKNSVCVGDSTTICANAIGATDGAKYLWEPENSTNGCITVSPALVSVYTITVVDGCGATTTASTPVYTNPTPAVGMYADFYQGCVPLCVQFYNTTTILGGIRQYVWAFGDGDSSHSKSPIYCYKSDGKYDVMLTAISDSGCSATLKKVSMITVYSPPKAAFTYSPQFVTILTPTIQFTDESSDATGIAYRWWDFGESGDTVSNLAYPIHVYHDTGLYCPTLIVMNNHGCTDTATNCLVVEPAFTLYIPSAFSPNGDGLNEEFKPKGKYIRNYEMYIFDRWGMELFHSTNIDNGWNGTFKGLMSQEDIYIYKITVIDSRNIQHSYIGNVTLIK